MSELDPMASSLLATYGTLMRSFGNHQNLGVDDRLTFVGKCRWTGVLYDLGRYPGAVPGEGTVHGDLFRLRGSQVWSVLDRYEGYDPNREDASLFVRQPVALDTPEDCTAWVYWYNGDPASHPRVSSGDWKTYVKNQNAS